VVNKQPVPSPLIGFLGRELIEAAVDKGVAVRPPQPDTEYCAFADPSGGVGDAFTAAVAHRNADGSCVLDCLHEVTASAAAPTGSCDHISPCPNVQKALLAEALGDRCGGAHVDEQQNALLAPRVVIAPGDEGEEHARTICCWVSTICLAQPRLNATEKAMLARVMPTGRLVAMKYEQDDAQV